MRRFVGDFFRPLRTVVVIPVRSLRRKLSPDRTRDETIQDRQNAFVWSEKHIFRPHQHFAYDPCSWSRPLEETMKKRRKLSLVERLRALEEQKAEATPPTQESGQIAECVENAEYFYSSQDTESADTSLQELLDSLSELHVFLTAPRHIDISLVKQERLRRDLDRVLLSVFKRVSVAIVGETMTFDALLYSWFLLLQETPSLLELLTEKPGNEENVFCAVATLRNALDILFLSASEHLTAPISDTMVLEACVELLDVVTHPLTRQSEKARGRETQMSPAEVDMTLLTKNVYERTMRAMTERMVADDGTELFDPCHLDALLRGMSRCSCLRDDASLQRAALLSERVVSGICATLKAAVAPSLDVSMRLALLGKTGRRVKVDTGRSVKDSDRRQIVLDACDPPSGIKSPPTAADEVLHATRACASLLRQLSGASVITRAQCQKVMDGLLVMLSYAPNYDLGVDDTITFACELLESGVLNEGADASVERHLRLLLVLSRLQVSPCNNQTVLCRLLCCMCRLTPPELCSPLELREWRRLNGITMHRLLSSLRVEAMHQRHSQDDTALETWEEQLAFGHYRGELPLGLWRDACRLHFANRTPPSQKCARALLALRPRCKTNTAAFSAKKSKLSSSSALPLDFETVWLLAKLLHVILGEHVTPEALMSDAALWDATREVAGSDEKLWALLSGAQRCVQERRTTKHIVTSFS